MGTINEELNEKFNFYLTDNIFLNDKKMFYKDKTVKQVKNYNWHKILREYGWEKLPKKWINKLNKYRIKHEKNSQYGILDCEHDGNCFFHCISHAMNEKNNYETNYDSNDIRQILSDSITVEQYEMMIEYYKAMKDANDFDEEWDPYEIESIEDFKIQLIESGHNYWGDYMIMQLLINVLQVNIFILNSNSEMNDYSIYNTLNEYNMNYDTICLVYEDECHFKLVGHFNGDMMVSYFTNKNIPIELSKMYGILRD